MRNRFPSLPVGAVVALVMLTAAAPVRAERAVSRFKQAWAEACQRRGEQRADAQRRVES